MNRSRSFAGSLFFVMLAACGASSSEQRAQTTGTGGESADPIPERCEGSCTTSDVCQNGFAWRCQCTEHQDVNCGGAARIEAPPTWQWECAPIDPAADRGDGCPFTQPAEGSTCAGDRSCRYGDGPCQWAGTDASCSGGAWHLVPFAVPPPP